MCGHIDNKLFLLKIEQEQNDDFAKELRLCGERNAFTQSVSAEPDEHLSISDGDSLPDLPLGMQIRAELGDAGLKRNGVIS